MDKSESQKRHKEYRIAVDDWQVAANDLCEALKEVSILTEAVEAADIAMRAAERNLHTKEAS